MVIAVALARTVRCNKTRVCGEHRGAFQRSNTTHCATRWAESVQKRLNPAIFPLIFTDAASVSACFAVRQNGAGERDDLVIAVALACGWAERSFNVSAKLGSLVIHRTAKP